ncbi:hypothetical protein [uncultured Campylobacter sp.]|uniref:hypothetical protein n=1 Tax=uncultured Campylobacter sp. TaxID=218934 RepID=UPI0026249E76|nr:hypothetical protein [uncultured Campylobacter sp.]
MPRIVCSRLQEPYKQRAACASVPASYIRSVTMTAVLKFEVPYGAIKFQNFKAGRAKLP